MKVPFRMGEIKRIVAMLLVPTDAIMLTRQAWETQADSTQHKGCHQQMDREVGNCINSSWNAPLL